MRQGWTVALALFVSGCKSVPVIVGLVSGSAAGGATANPALGFAVGVAVAAVADSAERYYGRRRQQAEQDAIAATAGALMVGDIAPWKVVHDLPFGNEHGMLRSVRLIETPFATCKEIAFSVDDGEGPELKRAWYMTQVCQNGTSWKWSAAEPAVERWGNLQ